MEVGNRIRRERQRLGISQENFLTEHMYRARRFRIGKRAGRSPTRNPCWFFPRYSERALMSS